MAEEIQLKIQGKVLHVVFEVARLDANEIARMEGSWCFPDLDGVERIEVDLRAVHFIDSSGVGLLLKFRRALTVEGGAVVLCHLDSSVRSVIEVLRLEGIFKFG